MVVEVGFSQQALELAVLGLQLTQPLGVGHVHPPEPRAPLAEGSRYAGHCFAVAVGSADLGSYTLQELCTNLPEMPSRCFGSTDGCNASQ